ncbi:hypothetical protein NLG97_g1125 [Lecanicillium saksenae]|uniref:Uncharacterized protein n=1 Tax=Lecanicillium saksenae TaxID=468837 RepID=A0ACC1R620_9HYPO|nr:hypothetical protein NLG97_g1125 [Lecanicillium saksenae]
MNITPEQTQAETVQLQQIHGGRDTHGAQARAQRLKPADGGRDAWVVLIASLVFEAIFWGFPMCFGVFQDYYTKRPEFQAHEYQVAQIGTLAQGIYYLGAPVSAYLAKRFPKHQRRQICAGWSLCIFGLLCASFAETVSGLIGTQGIMYGFGFMILTYPIISMLNEWWVVRKGMAFGLFSASSGLTGVAMPFIIETALGRYGQRITLQGSAVAMLALTGPLLFLLRGRLPAPEGASLPPTNWTFLKRPLFWIFGSATLIHGFGFFFPVVFLPSYATSMNISSTNGALLLSLMSIAQVLGQFIFGHLSDKTVSVNTLTTTCCSVSAIAAITIWGLGKSMALLVIFSLIYGFFGFGFVTLRVAMGRSVTDDPSAVFAMYTILVFLQGIGNVLVGPLSAALLRDPVSRGQYAAGRYEGMVLTTGCTSMAAAVIIGCWRGSRLLLPRTR